MKLKKGPIRAMQKRLKSVREGLVGMLRKCLSPFLSALTLVIDDRDESESVDDIGLIAWRYPELLQSGRVDDWGERPSQLF